MGVLVRQIAEFAKQLTERKAPEQVSHRISLVHLIPHSTAVGPREALFQVATHRDTMPVIHFPYGLSKSVRDVYPAELSNS